MARAGWAGHGDGNALPSRGSTAAHTNHGLVADAELPLLYKWQGFNLIKVGVPNSNPMAYRRGDLLLLSGCVTTVSPTSNKPGFDVGLANVPPNFCMDRDCNQQVVERRDTPFLAPTAMSRFEGVSQRGTSTWLRGDGKLVIRFLKGMNPMVLHISGFCRVLSGEEPVPIPILPCELHKQSAKRGAQQARPLGAEEPRLLQANPLNPPALHCHGRIAFLQGEFQEATFGSGMSVARLPEGFRPKRDVRWLAQLLGSDDGVGARLVDQSVALTIRADGLVSVQGGKAYAVDNKGVPKVLQQKKRGCLCLDGVRFALDEGMPLQLASGLLAPEAAPAVPAGAAGATGAGPAAAARAAFSYILDGGDKPTVHGAVCFRQGDVVMLEGQLVLPSSRPPPTKRCLARLPAGCWPRRREVFFTRGGSDLEERRRVDVDHYGRIFCPEGTTGNLVELTGIIFVAAPPTGRQPEPPNPDWDDLQVQYAGQSIAASVGGDMDGCEMLKAFVRRCTYHDWQLLQHDFDRSSLRKMLLPLGEVEVRGNFKNTMALPWRLENIWKDYSRDLNDRCGIQNFSTLIHVSDKVFDQIAERVRMRKDVVDLLKEHRSSTRQELWFCREPGLGYQQVRELAEEIVEQMFEHWDFKAQLQAALQFDWSPPQSIEHLFPEKKSTGGAADKYLKSKLKEDEWPEFEKIRQFFFLYETTGANMTHCSLMGGASWDFFTNTGKWHFPDSEQVQNQLFKNIAWLFPKEIYLYISERQTPHFPFIEDLDIQCKVDWEPLQEGQKPRPPDELLMAKPQRRADGTVYGDPGHLMHERAMAIHMLYPYFEELDVYVFSASGHNKGKNKLKSSFHLVWPALIVDATHASMIREVTLFRFQQETKRRDSYLAMLRDKLVSLDNSNEWELVFDKTTINARNGLRLPYSDKASRVIATEEEKQKVERGELSKSKAMQKLVREERPSKAVGQIKFKFRKDMSGKHQLLSADWVADADSYPIEKWIKLGTCRRDPDNADLSTLTRWEPVPEVMSIVKLKPGEQFCFSAGEDGREGTWQTHKPVPQIRRWTGSVLNFKRRFMEELCAELDQLKEEGNLDMCRRLVGGFVSSTPRQAIWRTTVAAQSEERTPDRFWGRRTFQRQAEVVYLKGTDKAGKVLVDGPADVVGVLLGILKRDFTQEDDMYLLPVFEVLKT